MSVFETTLYKDYYYVYAALFRDRPGDPGYIKFGMSRKITQRLYHIRTNCPIPLRFVAVSGVGIGEKRTRRVEKALHKQFADRKATGEWFRFDFENPDDKRAFNDGCRAAFRSVLGTKYEWWTKISAAQIDAYAHRRRQEYLNSPHRKKLDRQQQARRDSNKAQAELASYGT